MRRSVTMLLALISLGTLTGCSTVTSGSDSSIKSSQAGSSLEVEMVSTGVSGTGIKYVDNYYSCQATPVIDPSDWKPRTPHPALPMIQFPASSAMLSIYNNAGLLIGVPDSASVTMTEGECGITFIFSNFVRPTAPLEFRSSGFYSWQVPISDFTGVKLRLSLGDYSSFS